MFEEISYFRVFVIPMIAYGGVFTLFSFLFTASIAVLSGRGVSRIPFKWHPRMARVSLTLALFHGSLALLAYF